MAENVAFRRSEKLTETYVVIAETSRVMRPRDLLRSHPRSGFLGWDLATTEWKPPLAVLVSPIVYVSVTVSPRGSHNFNFASCTGDEMGQQ